MKRECLEQKLTFQRKTYIMCPKYMYREGNKYQHIYMSAWFFKCAADIKNRHLYCHYMHKIWISSIDHGCLSSCSCPERRGTSSTVLYTWIHWAFTQTLRMQKGLNVWLLHLSQTAVFFTVWHLIPITDLWEEGRLFRHRLSGKSCRAAQNLFLRADAAKGACSLQYSRRKIRRTSKQWSETKLKLTPKSRNRGDCFGSLLVKTINGAQSASFK